MTYPTKIAIISAMTFSLPFIASAATIDDLLGGGTVPSNIEQSLSSGTLNSISSGVSDKIKSLLPATTSTNISASSKSLLAQAATSLSAPAAEAKTAYNDIAPIFSARYQEIAHYCFYIAMIPVAIYLIGWCRYFMAVFSTVFLSRGRKAPASAGAHQPFTLKK